MNGHPFNPMYALPGLLCPLIGFALVVVIIVIIVRAIARAGSGAAGGIQPSLSNVVTQLGDDGFWIVSCPADPASMIHYHFWSGGVKHSGQVPFQPGTDGRQFVYTGARPEQVTIVRIVEPADDLQPGIAPPIFGAAAAIFGSSSDDQPDTSSAPPPPPQFPSAY
jgi:sugar/nucleoside kinase (ribokinase family)